MTKIFILPLLILYYFDAHASDTFSVEETFSPQAIIPTSVISDLSKSLSLEEYGCKEKNLGEALEATAIKLNSHHQTILVKPKAWCLCGTSSCPMWVYQLENNGARQIWSYPGTHGVEITDKIIKVYRQIRIADSSIRGDTYEAIWAWNGKKYRLIRKKQSTTNLDE